jgi:hypothetical protein
MKPFVASVIFSTGLCLSVGAQQSPLSFDETSVMKVDEEYRIAKLKNDTAALSNILSQAFHETNQNGNTRDYAGTLELWKGFHISTLSTDSFQVQITGDTAVVWGTQTETNGLSGESMLFTRVYTRSRGVWQLVSSMQFRNPKQLNF